MSQEIYTVSGYEIKKSYHGNWMIEYETDEKEVKVVFNDAFVTENDTVELNMAGPLFGNIYEANKRGGPSVITTYYNSETPDSPDAFGNARMTMRIPRRVHMKIIDLVEEGVIPGVME